MKKLLLIFICSALSLSLFAQKRIVKDTIFLGGKPVGITITNWYCIEGDTMPSFAVKSEDGKIINSTDLAGKTVVISFWINTCRPCMKELSRAGAELVDVYSPDKFAFIAIGSKETLETTKVFSNKVGTTFPLCYDESGEVFMKFADNGFPKLFVVDKKGIVRMVEEGYSNEKFEKLKEVVGELCK